MALLLYWRSLLCKILYSCGSMRYFDHNIFAMTPYTPMKYSSTDIFPFIFCFVEKLGTTPLPRDTMAPVCHQESSCTVYRSLTHHVTTEIPPTLKASFNFRVPLSYLNTSLSLPQSFSYGFFTHVVRNTTTIYMYRLALALTNSSCATVWCKVCDWSSGRYCVSS